MWTVGGVVWSVFVMIIVFATCMFGAPTRVVASAPAKLILCGEHFVLYGAPALVTALNLRTRCVVARTEGGEGDARVELSMPDVGVQCEARWKELRELLEGGVRSCWNCPPSSLDRGLLSRLSERFGGDKSVVSAFYLLLQFCGDAPRGSVRIHVSSEFPIGVGLGSSAAFHVSLVGALLRCLSYIRDADLSRVGGGRGSAVYRPSRDALRVVSGWAYLAEHIMHASPSGVDNTVSALGETLSFSQKEPHLTLEVPPMRFLIVNTGVQRSTKDLVARVAELNRRAPELVGRCGLRASQVARRIQEILVALDSRDGELGPLLSEAHDLLDAIGVGHESLTKVVALAKSHGFHSKLTGAGGGGCAMTFIPAATDSARVEALRRRLAEEGFDCFEATTGDLGLVYHE
ncbi:mevalonate kinase-like [Schistocerca gregaria]|uniref:mevalonate kinase-like n=1 Tax=Schistocerca gregaria TaxID=7010 RepID=UPI00211E47B1|nr:mevalonate kinase-like [Schistocerca gregaria]